MPKEILLEIENSLKTSCVIQWKEIMERTGLSITACLNAWYDYILNKNKKD